MLSFCKKILGLEKQTTANTFSAGSAPAGSYKLSSYELPTMTPLERRNHLSVAKPSAAKPLVHVHPRIEVDQAHHSGTMVINAKGTNKIVVVDDSRNTLSTMNYIFKGVGGIQLTTGHSKNIHVTIESYHGKDNKIIACPKPGTGETETIIDLYADPKIVYHGTSPKGYVEINGSPFADSIFLSGPGFAKIDTREGNDKVIVSGKMRTNIHAGPGNDTVMGGSGPDTIFSDGGNDLLEGGAGKNTFYIQTSRGTRTTAVGNGSNLAGGSNTFHISGNGPVTLFCDNLIGADVPHGKSVVYGNNNPFSKIYIDPTSVLKNSAKSKKIRVG